MWKDRKLLGFVTAVLAFTLPLFVWAGYRVVMGDWGESDNSAGVQWLVGGCVVVQMGLYWLASWLLDYTSHLE